MGRSAPEPAIAEQPQTSEGQESANAGWLTGTADEEFAQVERHLSEEVLDCREAVERIRDRAMRVEPVPPAAVP